MESELFLSPNVIFFMKNPLEKLRKEYSHIGINIPSLPENPFVLFHLWLDEALNSKLPEPNAMILSTVDGNNRPSSRTVLLKGLDEKGLIFFTNYLSRKGNELSGNPFASILFLWLELERQVRVEGKVDKIHEPESDSYFAMRPRHSQLGAWASPQSQVIKNRGVLDDNYRSMEKKFEGREVLRPAHWGGYRLVPDYFEFWQGRENRMHDRICFHPSPGGTWTRNRLAP